jgi:hypothetical protein
MAAASFVVLGAAAAAYLSLQTTYEPPTAGSDSQPCSPAPCADLRGYVLDRKSVV